MALSKITTESLLDGEITTAKLADDQITLAKMAGGTDGQVITYDASGNPVAVGPGTDGQVLTSTGAGSPPAFEAISAGFTLGTEQAAASGGGVNTFTGIPAGTTLIIANLIGVSSTAAWDGKWTIGDSGGLETSGYICSNFGVSGTSVYVQGNATNGFLYPEFTAGGDIVHGQTTFALEDSSDNTWTCTSIVYITNSKVGIMAGSKTLSGTLTQLQLNNGANLDAGVINIMYQ